MMALVVAIHDVSPSTAGAADRLRRLADARTGGPASLPGAAGGRQRVVAARAGPELAGGAARRRRRAGAARPHPPRGWRGGRRGFGCTGRGGARPLPAIGPGASRPLRRALSPPALRAAVASVAPVPCVRLDLHPADLHHPALLDAALGALDGLLAQGRRVAVHGDLIRIAAGRWR